MKYPDTNIKLKNGKTFDPKLPVEVQFDKDALKRLHVAIHFTKAMFPDNAIKKAEIPE